MSTSGVQRTPIGCVLICICEFWFQFVHKLYRHNVYSTNSWQMYYAHWRIYICRLVRCECVWPVDTLAKELLLWVLFYYFFTQGSSGLQKHKGVFFWNGYSSLLFLLLFIIMTNIIIIIVAITAIIYYYYYYYYLLLLLIYYFSFNLKYMIHQVLKIRQRCVWERLVFASVLLHEDVKSMNG